MKKTTTSNPLKFFNDAKAARNKSFKNGGINAPTQSLPKKYKGGPGDPPGVPGYPTDTQFVKDPNASTYKDYLDFYGGPASPGYQKQEPTWKSEKEYNDSKNLRLNKVNQELKTNSYWPYDAQNHPADWSPKSNLKKGGSVKIKKK